MARRRHKGPPLYDLITTRTRPAADAPRHEEPAARKPLDEEGPAPLGWINPGRHVAFPVGYVFVAVAVGLAVIILAFVFGHQRGEVDAEGRFDQTLLDTTRAVDQARRTDDPLLASRTGRFEPPVSSSNAHRSPGTDAEPSQPSPTPTRSRPIEIDPRRPGENYFVLATTRRDGAVRLAAFCRERGLEAYVVGGHNARFSQVIALPAIESASATDPLTRSMRDLILRIGREWERSEPGATDLSDAYVQLYRK